eukprot:g5688.t1
MSVGGKRGVSIPVVMVHEGEGHVVSVEMKNGYLYRGVMEASEDNWNVLLKNCILTKPNGEKSNVSTVYLRGDQISFVVLPPMLAEAPVFKRIQDFKKGILQPKGIGRAKANVLMGRGGGKRY